MLPPFLALFGVLLLPLLGLAQNLTPELKFDIHAVDKSADPCVDFYQYACGGWLARNPIPANRAYIAVFHQMREVNRERVRSLLQQASQSRLDRTDNERKIADYYASCMDEKSIASKNLQPLQSELDRIDRIKNRDDLAEEIAHLHRMGADAMFSLGADQALEEASAVIAYLDQSGLNLPDPSYYTSDDSEMAKARAEYRNHLIAEFKLLNAPAQQSNTSSDHVLRIETALANASLSTVQRRDRKAWYHEMTVAELKQLTPSFPWDRYFLAVRFKPGPKLNVAEPNYMRAVEDLLKNTPLPAWRSYLRWELARVATPALPPVFREAEFDFYSKTLRGVENEPSRTEQCIELTNRDLGEAVGELYVKSYFPPESKEKVLLMISRLRKAMREDFQEISWMSPTTRQEALRKLEMLRAMIGCPEHWRDYSPLEIKPGDALGNASRAREFEFARQIAKIGKPVDRGEFYELPQAVEGYHDNPLNVIVFTAGILQPPFFDPQIDDAINFGLAGAVIGHELTHAFDDKGRLFDGSGNMRDWWAPQDTKRYEDRAACFVHQYSNYTAVDTIKVDGQLTLGENIADNGGLQLAYRAFHSQTLNQIDAIDGYTPDQRFFLGWSQWRCMNASQKTALVWAHTDPHSPGRWRVNGVVSNMPAFVRAYHCKAVDPMVNKDPCRIW